MKRAGDYWVPDEEHLQLEALTAGGWQLDRLVRALSHVKRSTLAVDGGAHVGSWSIAMAKRFDVVLAFEPAPDSFACLAANLVNDTNVQPLRLALGDRQDHAYIVDDEKYAGRNTGGRYLTSTGAPGRRVTLAPLDCFNLPDLAFLKLDLEGYEPAAIRGALATLERCKPVVLFEDKARMAERHGFKPGDAASLLERLGAREVERMGGDRVFAW